MADKNEQEKSEREGGDEDYDAEEEEDMDAYADITTEQPGITPIKDERTNNDNKSVASSKLTFSTFARGNVTAAESKVARP